MKQFSWVFPFLAVHLNAQEVEFYWNAEDCEGIYQTNNVLRGKKTMVAVDFFDFIPDSVRFEIKGLADSLYLIDRYTCYFTPIDTNDFSITACVYYQDECFVLTKN